MAAEALRVCGAVDLLAREGARALEDCGLMVGQGWAAKEGDSNESL